VPPPAEAEVLAEALAVNLKDLVTKPDLDEAVARLEARILDGDKDIKRELRALEAKLTGEQMLLKWMMGLILGGVTALVLEAFF
jgi:hypothetical protein